MPEPCNLVKLVFKPGLGIWQQLVRGTRAVFANPGCGVIRVVIICSTTGLVQLTLQPVKKDRPFLAKDRRQTQPPIIC